MDSLITLLIIVLIIFIIALFRVKVSVVYGKQGFEASVKIAFFRVFVYPGKSKEEKKKKKKKEEEKGKKGGYTDIFIELLPDIKKFLSRFKKKTVINLLVIDFTAAAENPASAALMFGGSHAALGIILPFMENNFIIKKRSVTTSVDFTISKPVIYIDAAISISLGGLIVIGASFAVKFLKAVVKSRKNKAAESH